ncbi:hypothetical protein MLD38_039193 [Melastoma candidum]|uniref:Uncharacterized protein n=1 Tax=Melastoma candidum TaxID=119954 RepID=A0ACB9L2N1_9MYRT|nr:hypothetical protein MLD38_039193 [Melastoma candidum]
MAPKRQPPPPKPPSPPAESSEDDYEDPEEEEEENASEDSGQQSGSEASLEDDSESEQEQATPKPMTSDGKSRAKSSESESKGDGAPLEGTQVETSKKSFRRVWSDEDQLALLRGMIKFVDLEGKDPLAHIEEFSPFVQKSLSFPVTGQQLVVKIRALRFKYRDNEGKDKVFTRASEAEAFKLSRKIWGTEDQKTLAANGGRAKRTTDDRNLDLAGSCPVLTLEMVTLCKQNVGLSENYVRARINAADESKLQLLEERWKKQKLEEASILARKKALEADILAALMR